MNNMAQRLDYIDKAKGILISLVVIGHIWQGGYAHNVIYSFHMPAFFVISGILMSYTKAYEKPYAKFVLGRLYSFGIPFIFIELLGVATDIIRHGITLNIKGYIFNTITLNYNDPNLWFLVDLFLIEVVFVAAKKLLKNDWVLGVGCLITFVGALAISTENAYINTLLNSFRYLIFFASGFYGTKLLEKKNALVIATALLIPFLVAGVFGKRASWELCLANVAFVLSGFAGTYLVIQLGKLSLPKRIDRFFAAAGKNSIIIYGTHRIIYATVGVLMGVTDFASTPLWIGLIMLLTVLVAEVPIVWSINRYAPFLAGKRHKKRASI